MPTTWLERTINTPAVIDRLVKQFGKERLDEICSGKSYEESQAAVANALSGALDKLRISKRKINQASGEMLTLMLTANVISYMLGYSQGKADAAAAEDPGRNGH